MSDLVLTVEPGSAGAMRATARIRALLEQGQSVVLGASREQIQLADAHPVTPSVVLFTSGSTGNPRGVELDADAVRASAERAHRRLGGAGLWLTAIPVTGAGGLNTIARSLLAGTEPIIWPGIAGSAHFDGFSILPSLRAALDRAAALGLRAYTSFVPTQMARLVSHARAGDESAIDALRTLSRFHAVLVGADALSDQLRQAMRAYEIRFVSTYGATETCGGCVFDSVPLDDVNIEFTPIEGADHGRITISGPMVASRYSDGGEDLQGRRWISNDIGRMRIGQLEILGRTDDLVKVGGATIPLPLIAQHLKTLGNIQDLELLAREDSEWGHIPVAFVVDCDHSDATLRQFAAAAVGRTSIPLDIVRLNRIPLLANGKVDRQQLLAMVQ